MMTISQPFFPSHWSGKGRIPKLLRRSNNEWTTNAEGIVGAMDRDRAKQKVKGRHIFQTLGQIEITTWPLAPPSLYHPPSIFWPPIWKKKIPCLINKSIWEKLSWVSSQMFNHWGSMCRKETPIREGSPAGWTVGGKLWQVVRCWDPKGAFWWYFSLKWAWETYHNAPLWVSSHQWL